MPDLTAKRTLVKSPPELWEELSEVDRLARHLGAFGEITITKLEPEHTVAWEGERASGTVSIEPSGWGTKVTLRAQLPESDEPEPEPEPTAAAHPRHEAQHIGQPGGDQRVEPQPEAPVRESAAEAKPDSPAPGAAAAEEAQHVDDQIRRLPVEPAPAPEEEPRRGFWGWLFRRRTEPVATAPMPVEPEAAERETEPVAAEPAPEPLIAEPEAATEPEPAAAEPEPVAAEPAPEPLAAEPEAAAEPEGATEPEPVAAETVSEPAGPDAEAEPAAPALDPERARVILDEALDALGAAHHRPFSRG